MELLLAWLLLSQSSNKPLSEQDSSELAASLSKVMHTLESANDSMKKAEAYMNKKRQRLAKVEANAEQSFKKHKIKKTLIMSSIALIIFGYIISNILVTVNPDSLPEWLCVFVEHYNGVLKLIEYSLQQSFWMCMLFGFFFGMGFVINYMAISCRNSTMEVRTPLETFLESQRECLASEEREYKEYLEKCNDGLAELKVKALEINQYIQKRNQLKKSVS